MFSVCYERLNEVVHIRHFLASKYQEVTARVSRVEHSMEPYRVVKLTRNICIRQVGYSLLHTGHYFAPFRR
jgi:hypothetical protein